MLQTKSSQSGRAGKAFHLRQARPSDFAKLQKIENSSFKEHRFDESNFRYHYRNASSIFAVVEDSGEPIGYIAGIVYHGPRSNIAKIYSMAVKPRQRHKGVGSKLLKYFETKARAENCDSLSLEVRKSNRAGRSLYERHGFEVIESLPNYYAPGSDGLRMRKVLKRRSPKHDHTFQPHRLR